MSLDLTAIKAKLNQLNKTDEKRNNLWKPEPGKQRIRIVPYVHRKENPFLEMYFHYDIAKRSMLSPITFGNADPVVEFAEKLKKTGDKDEWLMGRKIEPKEKSSLWTVDLNTTFKNVLFDCAEDELEENVRTFVISELESLDWTYEKADVNVSKTMMRS